MENKVILKKYNETLFFFLFGAVAYSTLEIIWRGYTHWTMALLGGIVVVMLNLIDNTLSDSPFIFKCVLGAAVITMLEFLFGLIININFNMNIWSYKMSSHNILGQICPLFSFFWFLLCIVAFLAIKGIKTKLKNFF